MGPLPLRPLDLRRQHRLVLGSARAGGCLLVPWIRGLGTDGGPRGVGAPCPEGNVLWIRQLRTIQRKYHEREHQPGPGDQRLPERERHQQHHRGQPDDLPHGPSVLRRPERGEDREGGLHTAPERCGWKAPDQARGDELRPGGPVDPGGEAPAGDRPEGRREGTEAVPSAGQGTGPVRLPAAGEALPPGGEESREAEPSEREGQGAAAVRAQGTSRPGGLTGKPAAPAGEGKAGNPATGRGAGSGGSALPAEGGGAEGGAWAPATAFREGQARNAAAGRGAGSGGPALPAEGSGTEGGAWAPAAPDGKGKAGNPATGRAAGSRGAARPREGSGAEGGA